MKNNSLIILAIACIASAHYCTAATLQSLKSELTKLATKVITTKSPTGSILTERPNTAAIKKLNDFLKSDFVKFIGTDNAERKDFAKNIVDDFGNLLGNIVATFNKLAVESTRSQVVTASKSGSTLKGADTTTRKEQQLKPVREVKVVDLSKIPWGTRESVSTDAFVGNDRMGYLQEAKNHVIQIKAFVSKDKAQCTFQACKDRFDLLAAANNLLDSLVKKIETSIEQLRKAERKDLQAKGIWTGQ